MSHGGSGGGDAFAATLDDESICRNVWPKNRRSLSQLRDYVLKNVNGGPDFTHEDDFLLDSLFSRRFEPKLDGAVLLQWLDFAAGESSIAKQRLKFVVDFDVQLGH